MNFDNLNKIKCIEGALYDVPHWIFNDNPLLLQPKNKNIQLLEKLEDQKLFSINEEVNYAFKINHMSDVLKKCSSQVLKFQEEILNKYECEISCLKDEIKEAAVKSSRQNDIINGFKKELKLNQEKLLMTESKLKSVANQLLQPTASEFKYKSKDFQKLEKSLSGIVQNTIIFFEEINKKCKSLENFKKHNEGDYPFDESLMIEHGIVKDKNNNMMTVFNEERSSTEYINANNIQINEIINFINQKPTDNGAQMISEDMIHKCLSWDEKINSWSNELKMYIMDLINRNAEKEIVIGSLKEEIANLKASLNNEDLVKRDLEMKNEFLCIEANCEAKESKNKIKNLLASLNKLESKYKAAKLSLSECKLEKTRLEQAFNIKINELIDQNAKKGTRIAALKAALEFHQTDKKERDKTVVDSHARNLRSIKPSSNMTINKMEKDNGIIKNEITKVNEKLAVTQNNIEKLQRTYESTKQSLEQQIKTLKQQLAVKQSECDDYKSIIETKTNEIEYFRRKFQHHSTVMEKLKNIIY